MPCQNNGQCVPNGFSYLCQCFDGWTGAFCQLAAASTDAAAAAGAAGAAGEAPGGDLASGAVPTPDNPTVAAANQALATGTAPDDIAKFKARGWLRGKILGQKVRADGVARGSIGHNEMGGVTGVADAYGEFESDGNFGYYAGAGHARAAAATAASEYNDGSRRTTVLQGAAAAEASGAFYGKLPVSGTEVEAAGSASAQAQGTVIVRRPSNAIF